jgi:hypothetical protein
VDGDGELTMMEFSQGYQRYLQVSRGAATGAEPEQEPPHTKKEPRLVVMAGAAAAAPLSGGPAEGAGEGGSSQRTSSSSRGAVWTPTFLSRMELPSLLPAISVEVPTDPLPPPPPPPPVGTHGTGVANGKGKGTGKDKGPPPAPPLPGGSPGGAPRIGGVATPVRSVRTVKLNSTKLQVLQVRKARMVFVAARCLICMVRRAAVGAARVGLGSAPGGRREGGVAMGRNVIKCRSQSKRAQRYVRLY